jgi:hypothetical protein
MKFSDIFLATFIILIFMICTLVTYLTKGFKYIQDNWILYRCNPLIMPFSSYFGHDTEKNFGICVGQMQKDAMPIFTAPLHAGHAVMSQNIDALSSQVDSIRKFQGKLRPALAGNFLSVFNIFGNVISAFHQFINGFKDLLMRVLAVMATLLYLLQGQQMMGESIVNGPMMGAMRILSLGQIQ